MKSRPLAGLILADLQFPQSNLQLLSVVERYMASRPWDYLVYLGDFMDMDAISHHAMEAGDQRSLEGKRLKKDYADMAAILRRHRKIIGRKCNVIYLLGNHEEWADKFVDKFPMLEGMLEPTNNLPFDELNIEVIQQRHKKQIGKLHFIHGDISAGYYSSKHHAMKVVETYNRNVVYGHHHTLQAYTKLSPVGINETHSAYCIPALANIAPVWARNKPNQWLNGFGVFFVSKDRFTVLPIVAVRNGFIAPDGKEYTA